MVDHQILMASRLSSLLTTYIYISFLKRKVVGRSGDINFQTLLGVAAADVVRDGLEPGDLTEAVRIFEKEKTLSCHFPTMMKNPLIRLLVRNLIHCPHVLIEAICIWSRVVSRKRGNA